MISLNPLFLLLDGPANAGYLKLAEAYALGYDAPDARTAKAWNYEPVLIFRTP